MQLSALLRETSFPRQQAEVNTGTHKDYDCGGPSLKQTLISHHTPQDLENIMGQAVKSL